MMKNDDKIVSN